MKQLDDFTVDYMAIGEDSQRFLDLIKQFETEVGKAVQISNNPYFGRLHVNVYVLEKDEYPTLIAWLVFHGEEAFDRLLENGASFGETKPLKELELVESFKNVKTSLLSLDEVDDETKMIIIGPDSVTCFVEFDRVKSMTRDQLAKLIVANYVKKVFGVENEYMVRTDDISLF
ncbi:hypothetical protein [Pseudothermotoga thermarum]|uniref:Uncharacterized protein n=1 Tax=Pseudothermotoga thermarum DSM 5069 TaxID=688269 RepID=F7YVD3_9THEM|nr:hypothetical protein [Pseudothermotoga thermarum]AEH50436.1 hypothetical protein Theth_0341 [Pseudothermotoga thermarum DSM 5069]